MNRLVSQFRLWLGWSLLLLGLSANAQARILPEDGQSYRVEIPAGDKSLWLGAKPTVGEISVTRVANVATRWRFHQATDGSFTIESLEDGKRWLTLDPSKGLRLAASSAALASHWKLTLVDGRLLLESLASHHDQNVIVFSAEGAQLASRKSVQSSNVVLHSQPESVQVLHHGDVISIRSMAASSGSLWLDGNTIIGGVNLTTEASMEISSGAVWRVHDNGDGSFSFECLGNVPGRRWLNMSGPVAALSNTNDRNEATRWKVLPGPLGTVTLKNVTFKSKTPWLDSYPQIGAVTLAASPESSPGTAFQIRLRRAFDPAVQGRWSAVENVEVSGIHTHVLPDGKVLFWSRYMDPTDIPSTVEGVVPGGASTFLYDPDTGLTRTVPNSEVDSFCSGHAFLPDGRLLVNGGHIRSYVGPKATQIYDYRTHSWTTSPAWDMNQGRWYPTTISLGDGDILTVSGDATSETDPNRIPQVWSAQRGGWRDLTGLASSCFNTTSGPCMPLYPFLHLAPNGRVFVSGPGQDTGYIDTKGLGQWLPVARTNRGYRGDYEATSIMYAPGKILIAGGVPVTNSVETIDLTAAAPSWTVAAPMLNARHKLTSTLLADGQVFVSGGSAADGNLDGPAVFGGEIWNPATGLWTETDHMRIPRLYHASAVLLPDGRVLSIGGGLGANFTTHKNLQIYSPPYLFKGPRPTLKAPDTIAYGESFRIVTPEAKSISKAHLIRLSSDTHGFNSTQHIVSLSFHVDRAALLAHVPDDGNLAPPGFYLLFVVDAAGVPSLGKILQLVSKSDVNPGFKR